MCGAANVIPERNKNGETLETCRQIEIENNRRLERDGP